MWPWQRAQHADRPAEGSAVDTAARSPEWSALPPIQRSFGTLRPVSPQQEFGDSLVSWRNPSLLAPLGHLVSADAPAGVIHRLIEPAASPSDHSAGPALAFATVEPRRGVVQRILAAFPPRASQAPEPADMEMTPRRDETPRVTDSVAPVASRPLPVAPVQRSEVRPAPMTHAPSPALPVLELPVITAQSIMRDTAQTGGEPEAAASAPTTAAEPSSPGDSDVDEAPTLGIGLPPSTIPSTSVDGAASGPADTTGQECRAIAPAAETSGRPAPLHLTVQPMAVRDSAPSAASPSLAAPPSPGGREVSTLGLDSLPSPVQRTGVDGAAGGSADATGQERQVSASDAETSEGPALLNPMVQRVAEVSPAVPSPAEGSEAAEAPTLGLGPPPSTVQGAVADGGAPVTPTVQPMGTDSVPPVASPSGPTGGGDPLRRLGLGPPLVPDAVTAQRSQAAPPSPATLPSPATPMATAPLVAAPTLLPQPGDPSETGGTGVAGAEETGASETGAEGIGAVEKTVESPLPFAEEIAPLLGQSGSVTVQRDAAATDIAPTPEPMIQTAQEASPPLAASTAETLRSSTAGSTAAGPTIARSTAAGPLLVEPPLPVLPVLRVRDSSVAAAGESSPPADAPPSATAEPASPAPIVSAHPIVARLVGDRTPPLLTAPSATPRSAYPAGQPRQDPHGGASSIQRIAAEPASPGEGPGRDQAAGSIAQHPAAGTAGAAVGAPLRVAGYPNGGAAPLPVQLTPMVEHPAPLPFQRTPTVGYPAPVVQAASWQAPVVQTAPQEPAPAETMLPEGPPPAGAPAQDVPPEAVAGGPEEPDNPDQAPTAPPAGGAAAGGAAAGAASPDELVKKLFDPLLRRLKTELRLDRERRGVLTDLRH